MAFSLTNTNTILANPNDLVYVALVDGTGVQTGTAGNPLTVTGGGGGGGSNASVGLTGTTAPTSATEIAYINGSGNLTSPTALAGLPVSVQVQQAAAVTGNITGNSQTVTAAIAGYSLSLVTFHGTYAGVTVAFTLKDASGVFYPVLATALASDGSSGTSVTLGTNASGAYVVSTPGGTVLDITSTAYGSGTLTVEITPTADQMTYNAAVGIVGSVPAGTNIIGQVSINQTTQGTTNLVTNADGAGNKLTSNSTTYTSKFGLDSNLLGVLGTAFSQVGIVDVKDVAVTTGGYTPNGLVSAATTNATSIKSSAGTLGYIVAGNSLGTVAYVKMYNKASAPSVGTDVPVQWYTVPGNTQGAGLVLAIPKGCNFSTGIALAITGLPATSDTTAVALGQVVLAYGTI
jgi:hypothetical protein